VVETDGVAAEVTVSPDRRTVTAVANEVLSPGEYLAVGAKFTPGVVGGAKPEWQSDYDNKVAWDNGGRQVLNLFLGALGLLTLFGAPLVVYLLWYQRGRDPHAGQSPITCPSRQKIFHRGWSEHWWTRKPICRTSSRP
jgi:hypothetical protein